VASIVIDAGGLGHEAGGFPPPMPSPAPTSLVCPPSALPAPMLSRRPSFPTDAHLQAPVLAVRMELFIISLSYKIPYISLSLNR